MALRAPPRQERRGSANWGGCEVVRWSTGVRVPCTAAHAHACMHTLRVACLPVLYVGSSRVTTGWRVILSASGWADLTSRVWRTQLCCDPKPRLWPGGFGTFRKRTDMSGDALGTRSLSTPLPNHDGLLTGTCARECTQGVHVGSRVSLGSLRQPLARESFSRPVVGQTSRCVRVVVA